MGLTLRPRASLTIVDEADIALAALDTAHVVSMQVGQLCQFLLRQSALNSELAHAPAKENARISGHAVIIRTLTTMSLHTMSVIGFVQSRGREARQKRTTDGRVWKLVSPWVIGTV